MKKIFEKVNILSFLVGALIFSSITGAAAYSLLANNVGYTPKDNTWKNANGGKINNVEEALDSLYESSSDSLINKINFSKKNNLSYGDWLTSRSVSLNLEKGSYIIFLEFVDSYSSYSKSESSINQNVSSFSNNLNYSNGTCEIVDGDSVSIGSSNGIDNTNVHITAYSNTKVFKCNFSDSTTVSYTHTRPTAYPHVVEIVKLRSIKID